MTDDARTIHFVSLGCPKNRVDSEVMLGLAERAGYRHVADAEDASVIVVNTCGFIDAAKKESIDTILELSRLQGLEERCREARGLRLPEPALPARAQAADLPGGRSFSLGSSDMLKLSEHVLERQGRARAGRKSPPSWVVDARAIRGASPRAWPRSAYGQASPRAATAAARFALIPEMRGKQRSRADRTTSCARGRGLVAAGVLEVNLVSQDTVAYGRDLADGSHLADAVRRIADVPGLRWVRLLATCIPRSLRLPTT